jgi:ribulose-phosphate 3-epimerase
VLPEQWSQLDRLAQEKLPHASDLFLEAHLMVQKPKELGHVLIRAGVRRILAHVEAFSTESDMGECLHSWRIAGAEVGLAIVLDTPLERMSRIMQEVDTVQVMGIAHIGVQGNPFDPRSLDRVREIRLKYPSLMIEVDGGVTERTIRGLMLAGVNRCAVGSAIIAAADPIRAFHSLREAVA